MTTTKTTLNLGEASGKLKLFADETRLKILAALGAGEINVTELCAAIGMTQPSVSHHLALLRVGGVIEPRRDGKCIFYSMTPFGQGLWAIVEKVLA